MNSKNNWLYFRELEETQSFDWILLTCQKHFPPRCVISIQLEQNMNVLLYLPNFLPWWFNSSVDLVFSWQRRHHEQIIPISFTLYNLSQTYLNPLQIINQNQPTVPTLLIVKTKLNVLYILFLFLQKVPLRAVRTGDYPRCKIQFEVCFNNKSSHSFHRLIQLLSLISHIERWEDDGG